MPERRPSSSMRGEMESWVDQANAQKGPEIVHDPMVSAQRELQDDRLTVDPEPDVAVHAKPKRPADQFVFEKKRRPDMRMSDKEIAGLREQVLKVSDRKPQAAAPSQKKPSFLKRLFGG